MCISIATTTTISRKFAYKCCSVSWEDGQIIYVIVEIKQTPCTGYFYTTYVIVLSNPPRGRGAPPISQMEYVPYKFVQLRIAHVGSNWIYLRILYRFQRREIRFLVIVASKQLRRRIYFQR